MKLLIPILLFTFFSFAQVPAYMPSNGLVAWWPFDGNANDASGNGHHGTVFGAQLAPDRFGALDRAYYVNGTSYINVPHSTDFDFINGFTISYWVKPEVLEADSNYVIISKQVAYGPSLDGWHSEIEYAFNNHKFYFEFGDGSGGGINCAGAGGPNIFTGNWYFVVQTYDGVEAAQIVNAQQLLDYTCSSPMVGATTVDLKIGIATFPLIGDTTNFRGTIDDVVLWDRALTYCELVDLYNMEYESLTQVIQSPDSLSSSLNPPPMGTSFQWLDCDNNFAPIPNETDPVYYPQTTGNFAVQTTWWYGECVDTSACYPITVAGIEELKSDAKELVKRVDMLGRETQFQFNTPMLYIYSDGTRERVMKLEE